jgi:hypothetical protein
MPSNTAFVPAAASLAASSFTARSSVTPVGTARQAPSRFATTAIFNRKPPAPTTFSRTEQNRLAKLSAEDPSSQAGFTMYAEKVNGRLAQMGFVIGLATEILSKDHVTIADQILIMFSPLTTGLVVFAHAVSSLTA